MIKYARVPGATDEISLEPQTVVGMQYIICKFTTPGKIFLDICNGPFFAAKERLMLKRNLWLFSMQSGYGLL